MPESTIYEGKKLVLNGVGIRRVTLFRVQVYISGLYVSAKSQKASTLLSAPNPKVMRMFFIRDASQEQMLKGWVNTFGEVLPPEEQTKHAASIEKYCQLLESVKKGQEMRVDFTDNGAQLSFNGKDKGLIGDKAFSRSLLSVWLVQDNDKKLRDGLLGLSK